jgi:hypothetical protein
VFAAGSQREDREREQGGREGVRGGEREREERERERENPERENPERERALNWLSKCQRYRLRCNAAYANWHTASIFHHVLTS